MPGSPGLAAVTARFGADVLLASGELDRPGLRALVFADPAARRDLEAIVHPLIRSAMQRHIALAAGPYLVLVVPLLVESLARGQAAHGANRILVVDMDEAAQLARRATAVRRPRRAPSWPRKRRGPSGSRGPTMCCATTGAWQTSGTRWTDCIAAICNSPRRCAPARMRILGLDRAAGLPWATEWITIRR